MAIGELVVFEGPDGAGKSTLATAFTEYLIGSGREARLFSFPGREEGTLGWHVYQLHHDPQSFGIAGLTPESLQMLHVAAHLDAIDRSIKPLLREGITVVLDRYWWSTWVYGRESGANFATLDAMINCERLQWGTVQPAVLYLVSRKDSLRPDDAGDVWQRRMKLYHSLADQRHDHPIRQVSNDSTERETLDAVVTVWRESKGGESD